MFVIEFLDLRIDAECSPRRLVTLVADLREQEGEGQFVATLRSLCDRPLTGDLKCTIRDWAGNSIAENVRKVTVPAGASPPRPSCHCLPAGTDSWRLNSPS